MLGLPYPVPKPNVRVFPGDSTPNNGQRRVNVLFGSWRDLDMALSRAA